MFAGLLADNFDTIIISIIGVGTFENYTLADKLLDTYLLTVFLYFSLRWESKLARNAGIALFSYRLIGVIVLAIVNERSLVFLFPNLWEFFFIYQSVTLKWWPHLQIDGYRRLVKVLSALLILKLIQEYTVHLAEFQIMCSIYVNTSEFTKPYLGTALKEFADDYLKLWC